MRVVRVYYIDEQKMKLKATRLLDNETVNDFLDRINSQQNTNFDSMWDFQKQKVSNEYLLVDHIFSNLEEPNLDKIQIRSLC